MNRSEFMDYLLLKGECNRFDEHQIDALEQFCFTLYENTELDKPSERIAELEKENGKLKKEADKHRGGFVACMTGKQFTVNNLRQQAKGITDSLEFERNQSERSAFSGVSTGVLIRYSKQLNKQADDLGKGNG